jgi:hypothetical protein
LKTIKIVKNTKLTNFLNRVTQRTEKDIIFCYGPCMNKIELDPLLCLNQFGYDAYYYISPQSTGDNVDYATAYFSDLDAGRDSRKKYFSKKIVASKKRDMLKLINTSPLKPHYIVETRNGFQLYWCINKLNLKSTNNRNTWNYTQSCINKFFEKYADSRVTKINQILRLPETTWFKKEESKETFNCIIKEEPKLFRRYTSSQVYNSFKNNKINPSYGYRKPTVSTYKSRYNNQTPNKSTGRYNSGRKNDNGSYIWLDGQSSDNTKSPGKNDELKKMFSELLDRLFDKG